MIRAVEYLLQICWMEDQWPWRNLRYCQTLYLYLCLSLRSCTYMLIDLLLRCLRFYPIEDAVSWQQTRKIISRKVNDVQLLKLNPVSSHFSIITPWNWLHLERGEPSDSEVLLTRKEKHHWSDCFQDL